MAFFPMAGIVLALAVISVVFVVVTSKRRKMADADFGEVSHQWIAEHRLGRDNGDSAR